VARSVEGKRKRPRAGAVIHSFGGRGELRTILLCPADGGTAIHQPYLTVTVTAACAAQAEVAPEVARGRPDRAAVDALPGVPRATLPRSRYSLTLTIHCGTRYASVPHPHVLVSIVVVVGAALVTFESKLTAHGVLCDTRGPPGGALHGRAPVQSAPNTCVRVVVIDVVE
jgi:hypothetical protein